MFAYKENHGRIDDGVKEIKIQTTYFPSTPKVQTVRDYLILEIDFVIWNQWCASDDMLKGGMDIEGSVISKQEIGMGNTSLGHKHIRNDFDSFMGFMKIICDGKIAHTCTDVIKSHFRKMVRWFYENYLQNSSKMEWPTKVARCNVSLLDLYLTVRGMGGAARISIQGKWRCIAMAMGFPDVCAEGFENCFASYLSLVDSYYGVGKCCSKNMLESKTWQQIEAVGEGNGLGGEQPKEQTKVTAGCSNGTMAEGDGRKQIQEETRIEIAQEDQEAMEDEIFKTDDSQDLTIAGLDLEETKTSIMED